MKIVRAAIAGLIVLAIVALLAFVVVAVVVSADNTPPILQPASAVQSGTVSINTHGDDDGFAHVDYYFPACTDSRAPQCPVIVATLSDQIEAQYIYARAFSSVRGSIVIKLDEPTTAPIMVNWQATMPTARTAGEER